MWCVDVFLCQAADDDHSRTCERLPWPAALLLDPEAGAGGEHGPQHRKASHWLITSADRPFCRQSERADTAMPFLSEPRPRCQSDRRQDPL